MLANSGLVDSLAQLMEYQKGDDDMMLQLCYTFYCLVRHTDTREVILTVHRSMVETMIDLLQDKNDRIRRTASNFLDVVMDVDEEMAQEIRMRKFEIYNEEWMQAIEEDAQLEAYGPLDYRTAARTLFLRPYLAHFCPVFSPFFRGFLRRDARIPERGTKRPGGGCVTVENGRGKSGRRRPILGG